MSNENKIALVTGASRGIGKAITQHLGLTNVFVIGTATTEEGASAISTYMNDQGIKGVGKKLNVTDPGQVSSSS